MRGSRLHTTGLSVSYGSVRAVDNVAIRLQPGRLTGLIGPNGAGKTTFIDALTGFVAASGEVYLEDREMSRFRPTERSRAGLARTWQASMLFEELTVEENLAVASSTSPWWRAAGALLRGRRSDRVTARALLEELGIGALASRQPSSLPSGQRKLVGVARALAARPTVICLDEPAAGLNTEESQALGALLRRLVEGGLTMLLVDHDMSLVLSVCDDVVVLDGGRVIFNGTPTAVQTNTAVLEAYLGTSGSAELTAADSPRTT